MNVPTKDIIKKIRKFVPKGDIPHKNKKRYTRKQKHIKHDAQ